MPQRRRILQALGAMGLCTTMEQALSMGARPLPPGIRRLKGTVQINGTPAHDGQLVAPGDTVSTGAASEAIYVMGNNAYLMREDSKVQFGSNAAVAVLRIVTGKVLTVFGPGTQRIDMPTVTAGIRGTGCYVEAAPARTYFCLCYGSADLTPNADAAQARSITTQHHDAPFYIGSNPNEALFTAAPMINHRDHELSMLEALVGRMPPFAGKESFGY